MTVSRRNVLLQGCAIGAGITATQTPGVVALAQGQPPQRRSLGDLQLNERRAIEADAGEPGDQLGELRRHSWERQRLQSVSARQLLLSSLAPGISAYVRADGTAADWAQRLRAALLGLDRGSSAARGFHSTEVERPTKSAVRIAEVDVANQFAPRRDRRSRGHRHDPRRDAFETFGSSRPSGQDSLDRSWINCEGCGVSGTLEATPHNNVHNIVGGLMGGTQSALDPIFMMHHCNIDRIWAVWNVNNQNSNDPLWTDMISKTISTIRMDHSILRRSRNSTLLKRLATPTGSRQRPPRRWHRRLWRSGTRSRPFLQLPT